MIVRDTPDGGLLLVAQTDHSRLVGRLAARWGGEGFERPDPYESMARAAAFHDYGWLRYETAPRWNPDTGRPYAFLEAPLDAEQLEAYQWGLDWMEGIDAYSGLIVSMHRTGLWKGRYGTIRHPKSYDLADPDPGIQRFIDRNESRQAELRKGLDAPRLWINYRLQQVWDLLGLYFCCQEPVEDFVDPVPRGYAEAEGEGICLRLSPEGPGRVAMDPFPFQERPMQLELVAQRLAHATYPDLESFREAYYRAHVELLRFEIV